MKSISLCMIVKDEEKVLDNCLNTVKDIVDEIIIVDTGSNDKTIEIAKKYTHKIYNFKWENDFAKARNYSLSKATKDYILWLDADDFLKEESINRFKVLKESLDGSIDMYYFLYNFNEEYLPFYRERLFKNSNNYKFKGNIHEVIIASGNVKYENITIHQVYKENKKIDRNLLIFENMDMKNYSTRDLYYYGKELFRNNKLKKSQTVLLHFLKKKDFYVEDMIDSLYTLGVINIKNNEFILALKYFFMTFIYDYPRNNVLVEIANTFYSLQDYKKAIYYYDLAYNNKVDLTYKYFIHKDYLKYYPCMGLCLCYDKLGDYKIANEYNEKAYLLKKDKLVYEKNKEYFKNKLK